MTDRFYGSPAERALKQSVRVASTGNLTLSSTQTIDGIAVTTGDRILVKDQTDITENGLYIVDTGSWSRASGFDGARDCSYGTMVYVSTGTSYGDSWWRINSTGINIPGSSAIGFLRVRYVAQGITISSFARTLTDDETAAAMRNTLGLGTASTGVVGTDVQAYDAVLQDISALILSTGAVPYYTGSSVNQISNTSTATVLFGGQSPTFAQINTIRQLAYASTSAVMTTTTVIPADNSIPTSTEGTKFLSVNVTPNSTANTLDVKAVCQIGSTVNTEIAVALFRTGSTLAVATGLLRNTIVNWAECLAIRHRLSATSTSAITFDLNFGPDSTSDTITLNGIAGTQRHGGVLISSLTIEEIQPGG